MEKVSWVNVLHAMLVLDPIEPEVLEKLVYKDVEGRLKRYPERKDDKYIFIGQIYKILERYEQTDRIRDFLTVVGDNPTTEDIIKALKPINPKILEDLVFEDLDKRFTGVPNATEEEQLALVGKVWEVLLTYKQTCKIKKFLENLTAQLL